MNDEFGQLVQKLEAVLERARTVKDKRKRLDLAAERFELEARLINLLRPDRGGAPEKRKNVRVPCALPGRILLEKETHPCQVLNLSCGGVMAELAVPVARGTMLTVALEAQPGLLPDAIVLRGEAAWSGPPKVGIRFVGANEGTDRRIFALVIALLRRR